MHARLCFRKGVVMKTTILSVLFVFFAITLTAGCQSGPIAMTGSSYEPQFNAAGELTGVVLKKDVAAKLAPTEQFTFKSLRIQRMPGGSSLFFVDYQGIKSSDKPELKLWKKSDEGVDVRSVKPMLDAEKAAYGLSGSKQFVYLVGAELTSAGYLHFNAENGDAWALINKASKPEVRNIIIVDDEDGDDKQEFAYCAVDTLTAGDLRNAHRHAAAPEATPDNAFSYTRPTTPGSGGSGGATYNAGSAMTPTVITTQPVAATVAATATATFTVTATGTALTYQWRRNGLDISGATGASYTTAVLAATDNGAVFSVIVIGTAGSVTSNNALLTVN